MAKIRTFNNIDNFIYFYHLDELMILPTYPDSISDTTSVMFSQDTPLGRSAPIYSYANSGPRELRIDFKMHRELMKQVNYNNSKLNTRITDDLVDEFVKHIQAAALPEYAASAKMVNPPMIAVKFGEDVFCKGVVTGGVSVTYELPILDNGKYAIVSVNFNLAEVTPYDASTVWNLGSYRALNEGSLMREVYTKAR